MCVFGFGYAKCRFQHNVTKFQPIAQTIFRIEYLILSRNENEHCQTRCTRDIESNDTRTAVRQGTRDEREKESPKTADVQTGQKYQPNKQFTDYNSNNNRITVAHGIRFLFRNSYFMCLLCSHSNIFFTSFYYWW